ncbi:alpha/beta hydrolase [Methylotuvimicrobium buryatense]|uniref:Carboxylesterase n=1 Tax=Methylotuvimicrobium buryatense TaxID=95641 RepID=A0A4P9USQ0_METBY|nr:carboxylesterase [Methylotuvimicrobium buryatense]QCW83411.1 carboxylesterase [Methylotuvimicrobium buryatense]
MMDEIDWVEIAPRAPHRYTVIWMHGLGADGHDFEGIVPELGLPDDLGIRFCFPNAPVRPVTINGGMAMRAWYDIVDMSLERQVDKAGIAESSASILKLIDREIADGVPSENILLAGFSQGGVIALDAGLKCLHRLAGILALSCYLPTWPEVVPALFEVNRSLPIMMAHGSFDNVVARESGRAAFEALTSIGYSVVWKEYPMAHSVCFEEVGDIADFIRQCFHIGEDV